MKRTKPTSDGSYLFQVEILVNAGSNGIALEQLLKVLNGGEFADYRINSGIQLGAAIETALEEPEKKPIEIKLAPTPADPLEIRIRHFIESNKLIRLNVNKGRGIKMSLPCRVINFDSSNQLLTVYHVDEKQVYTVRLNEVDDFIE